MTIVFYDIASAAPGGAWSPSTWKVRYCLNFKAIPYRTEWIEMPDIEAHCKKFGIAANIKRNGEPCYTLPAIHDPSTRVYIGDSIRIAEYLEKQYPDKPTVFPYNTLGLQMEFETAFWTQLRAMWQFIVPAAFPRLNEASKEFYRRTRENSFGKRLEDIAPTGDDAVKEWAKVEEGFGKAAVWYSKNSGKGPFLMGETLSWADLVVGAYLAWFRIIWGEESREWRDIVSWHGGRWKSVYKALKAYETAA